MDESKYRAEASKEITKWKARPPPRAIAWAGKPFEVVGYPITKLLATDTGKRFVTTSLDAVFDAGNWKFDPSAVLDAYSDTGYPVQDLQAINGSVPMHVVDQRARRQWLRATASLTLEGGVSGPAIAVTAGAAGAGAAGVAISSGGTAGPPAAAAGIAVVGTATAAETALLIGYCCRRIAAIAACYGYDVREPAEKAFALSIFDVATADTLEAKESALLDLGQLAGRLGLQKQPWSNLEKTSPIAAVMRRLADKISLKLTQAQLRRALTVIGAAMGAGFNGYLGHSVTRSAYHLYRERFLELGLEPPHGAGVG